MIIAANDVRNIHKSIIHHDRKIVRGITIGPQDNKIIQNGILKDDFAFNEILNHRLPFLRSRKPKCRRFRGFGNSTPAASPIIFNGFASSLSFFSSSF